MFGGVITGGGAFAQPTVALWLRLTRGLLKFRRGTREHGR